MPPRIADDPWRQAWQKFKATQATFKASPAEQYLLFWASFLYTSSYPIGLPLFEQALRLGSLHSIEGSPTLGDPLEIGGIYERLESQSKGQGVFYTSPQCADYVTRQALGKILTHQRQRIENDLAAKDITKAAQALEQVLALKILDPACGCGVFLVQALHQLWNFYQLDSIQPLLRQINLTEPLIYATLRQLYGVDVDSTAVMLAQWSLWKTASTLAHITLAFKPERFQILCGDALEVQPGFQWQKAYSTISQWNVILGNPPYVTETRGNSSLFKAIQQSEKVGRYYQPKMDLCDLFLALSIDLLAPGGRLGFILPEYWTQRDSARRLREKVLSQTCVEEMGHFNHQSVFARAPGHHSSLLVLQKLPREVSPHRVFIYQLGGDTISPEVLACPLYGKGWLDPASGKLLYGSSTEIELLETLSNHTGWRLDPKDIQQGLVIPQGRTTREGIFVLTQTEKEALNLTDDEESLLKPYYGSSGFQAFRGFPETPPSLWLIYTDQATRQRLINQPNTYPHIRHHLDRYKKINTSAFAPYGLHRARQPRWFEGPERIYSLRQTIRPCFSQVRHPAFVNEGFYIISPSNCPVSLPVLVAILNSTLAGFWFLKQKRKGKRLQVDKDVLLHFPFPNWAETPPDTLIQIERLSCQLALNDEPALQTQLDPLIYSLYQLSPGFIKMLESAL